MNTLVLVLGVLALCSHITALAPQRVRIEHFDINTHADLVIDEPQPRFSWHIENEYTSDGQRVRSVTQSAYRITVSSATGVVWDSTHIKSADSLHIRYNSYVQLVSDTRYDFTLQYWSSSGAVSDVIHGHFRTALFDPKQQFTGAWIGSLNVTMNYLRKEFVVPASTTAANVFVSGVGYYHLYVNGHLVDYSRRLDPGWTTYQRRTYYASFNLLPLLVAGQTNAVGIMLGNGWYNQEQWADGLSATLAPTYGPPPRLLFQLNLAQQSGQVVSVVSDPTWTGRSGANVYDGIYQGTFYDARLESAGWSEPGFVDDWYRWLNASVLPSPVDADGILQLQPLDPIRIGPDNLHFATSASKTGFFANPPGVRGAAINQTIITPVRISSGNAETWDLQQTIAGFCRINRTFSRGASTQVRYAETLLPPQQDGQWEFGGLNVDNNAYIAVTDQYVYRSDQVESFTPIFTYHGFRYLSIYGAGQTQSIECFPAHSETTVIGNFTTSSTVINQIQHNTLWSMLSNAMSLPTDCTQRNERRGWLGDAGLTVDMSLFNFDFYHFYRGFIQQIKDMQDAQGLLQNVVPNTCCLTPVDPGWGIAYSRIAYTLYLHYNDTQVVSDFYDSIERWIMTLQRQHNQTGLANYYHVFGDWLGLQQTNVSLITSYSFLRDIQNIIELSDILGKTDKAKYYRDYYAQLATEWHRIWYNPSIQGYADGIQSANIFSLALPDVVPDNLRKTVAASLVARIKSDHGFTCGMISIERLFPVLSDNGYHDLAVQMLQQTSYPSYGYMFTNMMHNATTLWETWWGNGASYNHHMYGSVGTFFYRYLAGIELNGMQQPVIWPRMTSDPDLLPSVHAEVQTIYGQIAVNWNRISKTLVQYSIEVPSKTLIRFDPLGEGTHCVSIKESGRVIWQRAQDDSKPMHKLPLMGVFSGIRLLQRDEHNVMSASVDGGSYEWLIEWQ